MAFSASFDESNTVLGKPANMSADECEALAVLCTETQDGIPCVVSCWKFTAEEVAEINRTGRAWLTVAGKTMPPAHVQGIKPF